MNHLPLERRDVDHVLVGPPGVWVVETKWSSRPWQLEPAEDRVCAAVRQAAGNARSLRLWGELRAAGVREVHPVVMLWGVGTGELAVRHGALPVDGVTVVPGAAAASWRKGLPSKQVLTVAQVDQVWAVLSRQARCRDSRDGGSPALCREVGGSGAAGRLGWDAGSPGQCTAVHGRRLAVRVGAQLPAARGGPPFRCAGTRQPGCR